MIIFYLLYVVVLSCVLTQVAIEMISLKPNLLKESMKLHWNFRGVGVHTEKPSTMGVRGQGGGGGRLWIFSDEDNSLAKFMYSFNV